MGAAAAAEAEAVEVAVAALRSRLKGGLSGVVEWSVFFNVLGVREFGVRVGGRRCRSFFGRRSPRFWSEKC